MFTKINKIKNFAIFKDFDWDTSVRDEGRTVGKLKKLNIIYGRNYSGKTSLSRIMRSLELKQKHGNYSNSEYSFLHDGGQPINQGNLESCQYNIRVYNRDFVDDNLKWLSNPDGSIKPFAVLGEHNITLEKEIAEKEDLLGSEEIDGSLRNKLKKESDELSEARKSAEAAQSSLDAKLREKANGSIKTNPHYREVNYRINNIRDDITALIMNPDQEINLDKKAALINLLAEQPKQELSLKLNFTNRTKFFNDKAKNLLEQKVKPTETIQDLINDTLLQEWVRSGIKSHRGNRQSCAFCGGLLPLEIWTRLDAHFSKESDALRESIQLLITEIADEKASLTKDLPIKQSDLYTTLHESFLRLSQNHKSAINIYEENISSIQKALNRRLNDIFNTYPTVDIEPVSTDIQVVYDELAALVEIHNTKTATLGNDQKAARVSLRLDEVSKFIKDISYENQIKTISNLENDIKTLNTKHNNTKHEILNLDKEIQALKNQLKDERRGAQKVNYYLENHFGHAGLSLSALDNEALKESNFKIFRGELPADNLSEGECSLVAFCYFIAKLEDIDTQGKELIVWIDDPISSLDSNHIFFVYSLIEHVLASPIKIPNQTNTYKYSQLFISTHNLDFLKYLKKISKPKDSTKKDDCEYFILERSNDTSQIKLMPKYLKHYVTEFNYLFSQVHACAVSDATEIGHDSFYNFGNNLRKFLEAYLFYKFPNNLPNDEKLKAFFGGNQLASSLANRINNELSHLEEIFDRSMKPLDVPEISKLANFVLNTIKQKDPEQYQALLDSMNLQ